MDTNLLANVSSNVVPGITGIESLPYSSINDYSVLTPVKIATAYNIPASDGAGVKVGIISLGGTWSPTDLNQSMSDLGVSFNANNVTTVSVDGAPLTSSGADAENTLDLYCVAGMAPAANIVIYIGVDTGVGYYLNAPSGTYFNSLNNGFANLITRAVNEECDIISVSWGINEMATDGVNTGYVGDYLKAPLDAAAAKGISVLVATGDYGATGNSSITTATYPATNANVIAVGGTNLQLTAGNLRLTETAEWNPPGYGSGWGGGGGISSYVSVPGYQSGLTYRRYFSSNSFTTSPITLTTRGIPDISGPMNTYGFYLNGNIIGAGGTSAAAPIMAGMLARFMSLKGGRRPPSNAIHSVLYGNLRAYYDILSGNNATTTSSTGYVASSNWDPVTGVGIPWGNVVYQMVSSSGTVVKTVANNIPTWSYLSNVKVKTAADTWSNVKAIWTKTVNGWQQTF